MPYSTRRSTRPHTGCADSNCFSYGILFLCVYTYDIKENPEYHEAQKTEQKVREFFKKQKEAEKALRK